MRIDYGGAVIPWYEAPLAGGVNYTWQEKPAAPPLAEVKQYIANETYHQQKMQERGGGGGLGGFLTSYVNPILDTAAADPIKTAAMLAASVFAPELIPFIAGADTAIAGGSPEDVLKSAATAYVAQAVGGEIKGALGGAENIGLPSETPYIDIPDGEFLLTPDNVPSLLSPSIDQAVVTPDVLTADDLYTGQAMTDLATSYDATRLDDLINSLSNTGLSPTEIDQLTTLAPETGTEIGAYTTPIEAPVIGQPYDVSPLTDPVTGQPFGSIEEPLVDNYMDGFTSVSETGLATLPEEGMQVDLPGTTILGDLGLAGAVETPIPSGGISITQALRGLSAAKGLLGSGQEQAVAPATQFRGTRKPQGQVDYSGILNLLQMKSPQRKSLLG
jgi:hypothetical protein